jgi:arylsulfatase A-like enzyme
MNQRIVLTVSAAALIATAMPRAWSGNVTEDRKPNIIFILADDLGYGDLGCYGQQEIKTPHVDRMAEEGVRFTQSYAGCTVCAPSRSVLMTGQHTGHTWIRGNAGPSGERIPLRPEDVTVAEVLKDAGYATGIFGKWGLGEPDTTGIPNRQGFDEWFGYLNQHRAHFYYIDYLWHNEEKVQLDPEKDYTHDLIADQALEFIRQNRDRPFFAYLAVTLPHAECIVPDDEIYQQYLGKFPEKPYVSRGEQDYGSSEAPLASYAAMVSRLDRDVGRVIDLLKELDIDDNTIIFFTSDNGPHREGGNNPDFFNSNGPLRGIKRDMYEGGIRVPMVVRWPGKIQPGTESDQVWAFWDFLPTAAELAGTTSPENIDGISMVPALLRKEQKDHEFLYWEFFEGGYHQAVRMGAWKAVRNGKDTPLELYNLDEDIGETNNVAADHPEIVEKIEEYLKTARTESEYWNP